MPRPPIARSPRPAISLAWLPGVWLTWALLAAAAPATTVDHASGAEESACDLRHRIERLEAQIAGVKADQSERQVQRDRHLQALIRDVLADADGRASLLDEHRTAGWDDGFFLADPAADHRLVVGGRMQLRYMYSRHDDSPADDHRAGFENTRSQLILRGHAFKPEINYRVQGNAQPGEGTFVLEDAWVDYRLARRLAFRAGQQRTPMLREFQITSARQQAVERSLVHEAFTGGRTQGVTVEYRDGVLMLVGGISNGFESTGGTNQPALSRNVEYALSARGEALLNGTREQLASFANHPDDRTATLLGAAVHYQRDEYGTADPVLELLQWTIDGQFEFGGANLFMAVVGRHLDDGETIDADQFGLVVQGGVFLTDKWEAFGRYEWADDDSQRDDLSVVTVGVTHFFDDHRVKWTADAGYAFNEVSPTFTDAMPGGGRTGWRADAPGEDGQLVLRTQLQLTF